MNLKIKEKEQDINTQLALNYKLAELIMIGVNKPSIFPRQIPQLENKKVEKKQKTKTQMMAEWKAFVSSCSKR